MLHFTVHENIQLTCLLFSPFMWSLLQKSLSLQNKETVHYENTTIQMYRKFHFQN